MQISPLDGCLVSALSIGENCTIPLLTLTLTTITSTHLQNKQASRPPHVHITLQPLSKITVCKMNSSHYKSVKKKKKLKEWHWPQCFLKVEVKEHGSEVAPPPQPQPSSPNLALPYCRSIWQSVVWGRGRP